MVPPNTPEVAKENTPAAPVETPVDTHADLQKLMVAVRENVKDVDAWKQISKALESAKNEVGSKTSEQLQALMTQVDRLQQFVSNAPETKELFDVMNNVKERIASIRSDTYQRIQGVIQSAESPLQSLTKGGVLSMIPGAGMLSTMFSGNAFDFLTRMAKQMYHRTFQFMGTTKLFFGMDLKSVFGDVFNGHEQAIAELNIESALQSSIATLNKAQKQNNRPLFSLPPNWAADIEAKNALQQDYDKSGSKQPFEQFVAAKFGEMAKVFGGGPVSLRRLVDGIDGKKVSVEMLAAKPAPAVTVAAKPVTPEKPEGTSTNAIAT